VKKARELRKKTDLVAFQLTKMHDRLPPLSVYNRKFKLDAWQVGGAVAGWRDAEGDGGPPPAFRGRVGIQGVASSFLLAQMLPRRKRPPPSGATSLAQAPHPILPPNAIQCRVLSLVDQDRSAVVCAPTSSGKTVISTYVAVKIADEAKASSSSSEGGVLFVVPSEPLVWQVGDPNSRSNTHKHYWARKS
jgi:hypothetical protein